MLTIERITAAVRSLESGEVPDPEHAAALVQSFARWRSGLKWEAAIALEGSAAKAERNAAIILLAESLHTENCSPWELAERVRLTLKLRHKSEAAADACKQGAADLSRHMIHRILTAEIQDDTDET